VQYSRIGYFFSFSYENRKQTRGRGRSRRNVSVLAMVAPASLADDYAYVNAEHLNVRSLGSVRGKIAATVDKGYRVTVLETLSNGWKRVLLENGQERVRQRKIPLGRSSVLRKGVGYPIRRERFPTRSCAPTGSTRRSPSSIPATNSKRSPTACTSDAGFAYAFSRARTKGT
jgi:hypothetical protein